MADEGYSDLEEYVVAVPMCECGSEQGAACRRERLRLAQ
jgi:hypothetical protein